jgi:hypothetical protein
VDTLITSGLDSRGVENFGARIGMVEGILGRDLSRQALHGRPTGPGAAARDSVGLYPVTFPNQREGMRSAFRVTP